MCIITAPVKSVKSTKLFVAPSLNKSRQITAYLNTVDTGGPNLMILPVPYPATVKFETELMASAPSLFEDLALSFRVEAAGSGPPAPWSTRAAGQPPPLEVQRVGPYVASIAAGVADLERLDPAVFPAAATPFPAALREMLVATYPSDIFGFLCCQLAPGLNTYEPLIYTHRLLEKGGTPRLFLPTKHFHPHGDGSTAPAPAKGGKERWDHVIYSAGTVREEAHTRQPDTPYEDRIPLCFYPKLPNAVRWEAFPADFQHGEGVHIHRWFWRGTYDNKDLEWGLLTAEQAPTPPIKVEEATQEGLVRALPGLRGIWR